jgi:hypothetical protein
MKCCAWECLRTSVARMAIFFGCELAEASLFCETINPGATDPRHAAAPADTARVERNSRRVRTPLLRSGRDETDGSGINYDGDNLSSFVWTVNSRVCLGKGDDVSYERPYSNE